MATVWAIGELVDGAPTKLTLELATPRARNWRRRPAACARRCSWRGREHRRQRRRAYVRYGARRRH